MARRKRKQDDFETKKTFLQVLLSPITAVQEWFADALGGDDSLKTGDSGFTSVFSILTFPFRFLFAIAVFMVQAWSTSRVGRAFVLGLPAVTTVAGCLAILWVSTRYFNAITLGRSVGYYALHTNNPDAPPENALMFAKKYVGLKPEDPKGLFRLGLALEKSGDSTAAVGVMNMLAPPELPEGFEKPATKNAIDKEEDKIGDFFPAHLWLSNFYQRQISDGGFSPEVASLADKHLTRAAENSPENRELAISRASLFELRSIHVKDKPDEYIAQLRNLESSLTAAVRPPLQTILQVAQIPKLIQTKRKLAELDDSVNFEQAKKQFGELFDDLLELGRKNSDGVRLRIINHVVSGYVQLKEYDKAVSIISQSLQSFDATEIKRRLVNNAGVVFLKNAEDNSDLDDQDQYNLRLTSICACLNSSIKERRAYEMLIGIIRHNQIHPEKFEWLQDTMLDTPKPAVNHLLVGCHLIHTGIENNDQEKVKQGTSHWKIAYKIEAETQLMLSNIIEIGLFFESVPIGSIEEMIQQAISMFPDKSLLHRSAGLLLMSRNDLEAAIPNFEAAAATHRFPLMAHLLLKHCHELAGNSFKALNHDKTAKELLSSLPPQQQELIKNHVSDLIEKTAQQ